MKEKEFDQVIKQKLEGVNDAPPADMWNRIATNIPAASTSSTTISGGMSNAVKITLLAASLLIVSGLSYLVFHKEATTERSRIENSSYSDNNYSVKHKANINDTELDSKVVEKQDIVGEKTKSSLTNRKQLTSSKSSATTTEKDDAVAFNQQFDKLEVAQEAKQHKTSGAKKNKNKAPEVKKVAEVKNASFVKPTVVASNVELLPLNEKLNTEELNQEEETISTPSKTIVAEEEQAAKETIVNKSAEKEVSPQNIASKEESAPEKVQVPARDSQSLNSSSAVDNPKNRQLNKYSLGLHYGPEFMDVNGLKLTDQAVDFSFNYQNFNFILQTGIGFRVSNDRVAYNMKYKRWDYLETQIRFDSAVIVLDQNGKPVLKPVDPYYVEVYDSLNHSYTATATEQNLMIQIPLLVGYQVDYKKFAYFVKGGIRYSVVVYKNTKDLMEIDEKSHLVNMNYASQSRAKSNINYELALGGAYKLRKQFQIQVELFGRYYHYSIYEENPPSGVHPWSLSGRVGLVYNLK